MTAVFKRFRGRGRHRPGQMNRTESRYSLHLEQRRLNNEIHAYWFESLKFKLADNTFYSPDFLIMNNDLSLEIHEVKATKFVRNELGQKIGKPLVYDDAAVKIKVAADKYYPFKFVLVHFVNGTWTQKEY